MAGTDLFSRFFVFSFFSILIQASEPQQGELYSIEGKIRVDRSLSEGHEHWLRKVHVFVDGGEYISVPE